MNLPVLMFALLLSLSGCIKKHKVTEAEILGAWESTAVSKPFMRGLPSRNRMMFHKLGNRLIMAEYTNWKSAEIGKSGDTLVLQDKCLRYVETLQFREGGKAHQDTLVLGVHRKFTRIDDEVFTSDKQVFLDGIHHRRPL